MQRDQTGSANSQLRRERQQRGWSQAELALRVGSGAKSVARWEAKRAYPTPYYRQKLCELFGKTADELGLLTDDYLSDSPAGLAQPSAAALPSLHAAPAPVSASDLIRHYRSQAGLSQQELAKKLEISNSYLSEIEKGVKTPTIDLLQKYSALFKMPLSTIMLFSESLDEDRKPGAKLRVAAADKILKLLEWLEDRESLTDA